MVFTVKGFKRAASKAVDDLEEIAAKAGKKAVEKGKAAASKAGEYVPPPVKEAAGKAKDAVEGAGRKTKEYGKKLADLMSEDDEIDKFAKAHRRNGRKVTEYTRKTGRYHYKKGANVRETGQWIEDAKDRLDKGQVAKDAAVGAGVVGAGAGAIAAMSDDEQEDMVAQIKRKMREGKELTQSEKRLLRLMEA